MLISIPHLYLSLISDKIVPQKQAIMLFKALNNLTPTYITNLFKLTCTNLNHSLKWTTTRVYVS